MYSVYIHVFPNQKVYVGITRQSVEDRWKNGRSYVRCVSVDRAIKKYGWENIKHEVIRVVETKEDAERLEKLFIYKYGSNDPRFGYNLTSGGGAKYGLSEESREKIGRKNREIWASDPQKRADASSRMKKRMSDPNYRQKVLLALQGSNRGRKFVEKTSGEPVSCVANRTVKNDKAKQRKVTPIVQLTKDGAFVKIWGCACDAERAGIADAHNIRKCCKKTPQYRTAGGYVWVYESEYCGTFQCDNSG